MRSTNFRRAVLKCVIYGILILIQVLWLVALIITVVRKVPWFSTVVTYIAAAVSIYICTRKQNSSFRLAWVILISAFPILGIILYLLKGTQHTSKTMEEVYKENERRYSGYLRGSDFDCIEIDEKCSHLQYYLSEFGKYPVWDNTETEYIPDAFCGYNMQIEAAREARHFIFLEYFAIEDAECFDALKGVLKEKSACGVEVKIIYDDVGSIAFIDRDFISEMEQSGIECRIFNPIAPFFKVFMNNRDHRKIMIVDGVVGFTGGYNIAREYFHMSEPYGFWKDTGVMVKGDAVKSLTAVFLTMWDSLGERVSAPDKYFEQYLKCNDISGCYVQPYADDPLDDERVGYEVYMNILREARDYVYFSTPYLIISDEMKEEIVSAVKRGIDVRIVIPGIPDKKSVYHVSMDFARELMRQGVKVYRYIPGFNHAKMCVSDDSVAVVSTVNLDYRSLYHHYECGVAIYDDRTVMLVCADLREMFCDSEQITNCETGKETLLKKMFDLLLRMFAPLL